MEAERLVTATEKLKDQMPDLEGLGTSDPAFKTWSSKFESLIERLYDTRLITELQRDNARDIRFFPMVLGDGDNTEVYARSFKSGLEDARAFLGTVLSDYEDFGSSALPSSPREKPSEASAAPINLHVSLNATQQQNLYSQIDIEEFGSDVKEKLDAILEESAKRKPDQGRLSILLDELVKISPQLFLKLLETLGKSQGS
jgi:hypothetical protein